ncbi:MAG: CBS domain-containing protein [Candidatus Aenigmatarchaeota archaeon]
MINGYVKDAGKNLNMSIDLSLAGLSREEKITQLSELNPTYCFENEQIRKVVDKIIEKGHRRLPILSKDKRVVGIITTMDILEAFLRKQNFQDPISTIMNREVIFCDANETLGNVLLKFKFSRRGGFPITKNGKLVGMISERDIVRRFSSLIFGIKVEEAMTKKPFFLDPKISILDAIKSMVNTHYRRLPLVKDKKLVGIFTSADALLYLKKCDFNFSNLFESVMPTFTKEVYYIEKDKDLSEAIKEMVRRDVGGLPVVGDDGVLEGIITERDILEEIV